MMKRHEQNLGEFLDKSFAPFRTRFSTVPQEEVGKACERVLSALYCDRERAPEGATVDSDPVHLLFKWRQPAVFISAATVVLAVFLSFALFRSFVGQNTVHGFVEAANGSLYRVVGENKYALHLGQRIEAGESIRSNDEGGAVLSLPDGSHIEMRSRSELLLESADDGVRVHLNTGGIIVSAARQNGGHLYVQTKDVIVSVVGTVFLVNAEETGSRVAVIEGKVHVQQGAISNELLPGEQVSTNPTMPAVPVVKEISWSRNAVTYMALLLQAPVIARPPSGLPRLEFAVASIRPDPPQSDARTYGFSCHGTDGVRRARFGGPDLTIAPQGRCAGNGVPLSYLIAFAYGIPLQYVSGGPDWVRPSGVRGSSGAAATFQIAAETDDPSGTTTEQLRQMLRTMLTDRFKLQLHHETHEVSGYALVISKKGPKLKHSSGDEEEPSFSPPSKSKLGLMIKGKTDLGQLALYLNETVGPILDSPVLDKTGLMGVYEYEFVLVTFDTTTRNNPSDPTGFASDLSARMEDQLGLRLQAEKVPFETIVIDEIERPSPN
jgi:uncharacterized protein (TIGR03435 family)